MKIAYSNVHQPLMGLFLATMLCLPAWAQEDRNSELDPTATKPASRELLREGESFHYTDPEKPTPSSANTPSNTVAKENTVAKDSVYSKPNKVVRPAEGRNQKEEDPSVLSFNFLYYIIQRFKLSDIID
jgi:hypothetical protein